MAERFGKRHGDVLRAIRNLETPSEFNERNFASVEYLDEKGESRPMYLITRDGFAILAMGFTGKEAALWKVRFLSAFNDMADQLRSSQMNLWRQMQALIAHEVESKVRASFGSRLMLERKREIPWFRETRKRLENEIQPSLLTH